MEGTGDDLPFVDEHQVDVDASAAEVWYSLARHLTGARLAGAGALAQLLGADPRRATGTLLDDGASVPGFAVTESVPERRVRLTGRHRFSRYQLVFTLDPAPGATAGTTRTTLTARTLAEFPGLHGAVYRRLVIGSGTHRVLVRRLLDGIRRQAERHATR